MKWQKKKSQNEKMAGTKNSSIHSEVILYLLFRNMTVSFSSERAYSREVFPIGRIIREHIKKTHTKRMECTHYESLDVFFLHTHTHLSLQWTHIRSSIMFQKRSCQTKNIWAWEIRLRTRLSAQRATFLSRLISRYLHFYKYIFWLIPYKKKWTHKRINYCFIKRELFCTYLRSKAVFSYVHINTHITAFY